MGARSAVPFAVIGFAAWWILAARVWQAPEALGAPLGGIIAALVAFHVFASEGPQRPASVVQAAVADGVVAGIIAFATIAILFALRGGQARSGWLAGTISIVGCAVTGGAVGALLGWAIALVTEEDLLRREPAPQTKRRRSKSARRRRRK